MLEIVAYQFINIIMSLGAIKDVLNFMLYQSTKLFIWSIVLTSRVQFLQWSWARSNLRTAAKSREGVVKSFSNQSHDPNHHLKTKKKTLIKVKQRAEIIVFLSFYDPGAILW